MKYLFLFTFLGVIWWVWKKRNTQPLERPKSTSVPEPEQMVSCAHCGVYLPAAEALVDADQYFCCLAHRQAAGR